MPFAPRITVEDIVFHSRPSVRHNPHVRRNLLGDFDSVADLPSPILMDTVDGIFFSDEDSFSDLDLADMDLSFLDDVVSFRASPRALTRVPPQSLLLE